MHEHFFVALTLDKLLSDPKESAQTVTQCFTYAAQTKRQSALKAVQMIVKR